VAINNHGIEYTHEHGRLKNQLFSQNLNVGVKHQDSLILPQSLNPFSDIPQAALDIQLCYSNHKPKSTGLHQTHEAKIALKKSHQEKKEKKNHINPSFHVYHHTINKPVLQLQSSCTQMSSLTCLN
jgi:hypothetical protein